MSLSSKTCTFLGALVITCIQVSAQNNYNFDFEEVDKSNQLATGWAGTIIKLDSLVKQHGQHSLSLEKAPGDEEYSSCYYRVRSGFRGEKVTLKAYIKAENIENGTAGLWVRSATNGQTPSSDNMMSRAIIRTPTFGAMTST